SSSENHARELHRPRLPAALDAHGICTSSRLDEQPVRWLAGTPFAMTSAQVSGEVVAAPMSVRTLMAVAASEAAMRAAGSQRAFGRRGAPRARPKASMKPVR